MADTQAIPMYQGEDFSQELSYFTDEDQLTPLVFTNPVMDVRNSDGLLLASFDDDASDQGTATVTGPGVLVLAMPHTATALLAAGTYALDIFADVGEARLAITKRGVLKLVVSARITQDDGP